MKTRRFLIALSVPLLTVGIIAVPIVWDRLHTLYPTAETESAFIKNYTPRTVIEQFEDKQTSSSFSDHRGAGAGRKFVTHTDGFDGYFALRSEKWMTLMNALRDDVAAQLVGNGAQILSQSGDAREGFHFGYKLDKSVGSLTIFPLEQTSLMHRGLPNGVVDTHTSIELTEKWFPKDSGMIQARVTANRSIQ